MKDFCVIIPAVKKNVAFPDDLIKKLNGVSLIERAIAKAKNIASGEDVFVVTDSEEISLSSERGGVKYSYKKDLRLDSDEILQSLGFFLLRIVASYKNIIVLWPYTPLLKESVILNAYRQFCDEGHDVITTVREEHHRIYTEKLKRTENLVRDRATKKLFVETKAFFICKASLVRGANDFRNVLIAPYRLPEEIIEIKNYQDWWVCEKLLKRKRIVFRVIGDQTVGMGHIYRSLALAHEISDHEIIFVCDDTSDLAVNKIAGTDYLIKTFPSAEIDAQIVALHPDLVINDILDTTDQYVMLLRNKNIKVVNFEDLGSGAACAHLTINELYDEPLIPGRSILWGSKYCTLRDEFLSAIPHRYAEDISDVLITFGGTDQNDLTLKTLRLVARFCKKNNIRINIVAGYGYLHEKSLQRYMLSTQGASITYARASGVISKMMERSQVAITSNGRTVYELAHMHVPSVVISQHDRERTHSFACEKNGFVHLEKHGAGVSGTQLLRAFVRIVNEFSYRKRLFRRIARHHFSDNKKRVVKRILDLLA
jgi:spore coat polysaccharide biosynthesis predicted glycosyltransferase SpsG/CMP-N-acetylneuraminic acid synthetase